MGNLEDRFSRGESQIVYTSEILHYESLTTWPALENLMLIEWGGGGGGEDGRRYIFLRVVGVESFQIIWVVGVRPNLIT